MTHRCQRVDGWRACFCAGLLCLATLAVAQDEMPSGAPPLVDAHRALPFAAAESLRARKLRGFKAEIAHWIFTAQEGGEIAVAASALPLPSTATAAYVPLFVEIDGASLLSHNQAASVWLEIYAYAVTPGGSVAGHFAEAVQVDVAVLGEVLVRGGLKYYGHLELPAGEYQLRVLVRNPQSGASGVRLMSLVIPNRAATPVAIFPEPSSHWIAAVEAQTGATAIDTAYPFVIGGRALSPAARQVLASGRETAVHIFGADLNGWTTGRARFLAPDSKASTSLAVAELAADGPRGDAPGGLEARAFRFRPPELPAGEYRLRFEFDAPSRVTPTSRVWVTAGDVRERDLLWTDLRWLIDGDKRQATASSTSQPVTTRAAARPASEGRQRKRVRRAAESYRVALVTLASQPFSGAAGVLFELEAGVLGRGAERLEDLRMAEIRVAVQLADKAPESLVPLLAAHLDLYRMYRDRRLHSLMAHSRQLIEALVEIYAGAGGSGRVAADVLACLGGDLQEADLTASSQRLFGRALEYAPDHLGALLGLATSFERRSQYQPAMTILERLVEGHPEFAEGRLRLAINLDRLGLRRRSKELLGSLAASADPPWVVALAAQQLARRHLETGDLTAAELVLVESIRKIPAEPGPRVLLAYLYDRQMRPEDSLELLRDVRPQEGGDGSAAKIYDSWPRGVLDQARAALAEQAERRRAGLAELVTHSK